VGLVVQRRLTWDDGSKHAEHRPSRVQELQLKVLVELALRTAIMLQIFPYTLDLLLRCSSMYFLSLPCRQ